MANKTRFILSDSLLENNAVKLSKSIDDIQRKSLMAVGKKILENVDNVEPKIPELTGKLKKSSFIRVSEGIKNIFIGFNVPYAAAVHENIRASNWSRPGSGPKFLETKLHNPTLRKQYSEIIQSDGKKTLSGLFKKSFTGIKKI
jgi:hypothetical protein